QMLRQHGRSRSMGRSSFTLRPINVGAPNRLMFIRALLARRGVEDGVRRLRRRLEKAEAVFLSIEALETRSTSGENVPDGFTAVVDVGEGRYGDARGHWRLPERSSQLSSMRQVALLSLLLAHEAPGRVRSAATSSMWSRHSRSGSRSNISSMPLLSASASGFSIAATAPATRSS